MYVTVNFDVEDIVYPPEAGIDDISLWIAAALADAGLRGTFHVIGDKARALAERGRSDVAAAMADHDIGIHTNSNNHPLVPEMVEHSGWTDGVEQLIAYEQKIVDSIKAVFWKEPVATSRHAVFTSPHSYGAAAEMGLPYVYSNVYVPGHAGPVWFAGALCFPTASSGDGPSCCLSVGLEPTLSHDQAFEEKMALLAQGLDRRVEAGLEYLTLFAGHPVRVRAKGWSEDHLFANGRNRTVEQVGHLYELKTDEEVATARRNFGRFCAYLAGRADIEVIGIGRAAELFADEPGEVSRDIALAYCTSGDDPQHPHLDPHYSPAEMLAALAEMLTLEDERGTLPRVVDCRQVIGPVDKPVLMPEQPFVTREEFLGLCRDLLAHVDATHQLPANLALGDARIGVASLHAACVAAFAAACRGEQFARIRLPRVPRYPAFAHELEKAMAWIEESSFLGPEFSADNLRLHTRLQTWSLKPATTSMSSGPYLEAGGFVPASLAMPK